MSKNNARAVCVLFSGGLDSTLLIKQGLKTHKAVFPLYIRFGLVWEKDELRQARNILKSMRHPSLKPLRVLSIKGAAEKTHWSVSGRGVPDRKSPDRDVYIPGRNLLLLSLAFVYCERNGISKIWIGTLKANPFGDTAPRFFKTMEKAARLAMGAEWNVEAPFNQLKKMDLLPLARGLNVENCFSCLSPRAGEACRQCNKCEEKRKFVLLLAKTRR